MAFVFALARYSASPLYILDEIDAALDEPNQVRIQSTLSWRESSPALVVRLVFEQRAVAKLIKHNFAQSQVICISHHVVRFTPSLMDMTLLLQRLNRVAHSVSQASHAMAAQLIQVEKHEHSSAVKYRSLH